MKHLYARARFFSKWINGALPQERLGQKSWALVGSSPNARARLFLLGFILALGGCNTADLSGTLTDTEKEQRQGGADEPREDDGGTMIANPDLDEPETIVAHYACEQEGNCPADRLEPWTLWTDGALQTSQYSIDYQSQSSFFGQLEISVNRGAYYDLSRITQVYVDAINMVAYLKVSGLPDKAMPLRNAVMQGQSVWQLGTWSVQSQTVTSWWLTMRNSRWVSPVRAAVDLCLHASQTGCHTLYMEVSEDYGF